MLCLNNSFCPNTISVKEKYSQLFDWKVVVLLRVNNKPDTITTAIKSKLGNICVSTVAMVFS